MTEAKEETKEGKKGFSLPPWVWKLLQGIAGAALIGMSTAAVKIYNDTLTLNRDMARVMWHNEQQDARIDRTEDRVGKTEANQELFHREALQGIDGISELLQSERRERRRR